jgi:hypothetical protein
MEERLAAAGKAHVKRSGTHSNRQALSFPDCLSGLDTAAVGAENGGGGTVASQGLPLPPARHLRARPLLIRAHLPEQHLLGGRGGLDGVPFTSLQGGAQRLTVD